MNQYVGYEKDLQEQLEKLKKAQVPIVLFGTMAMGQIGLKTINLFNKEVTCFCDNNKKKQGLDLNNIPVLSPEQVKEKYPNAIIYICSFNKKTIQQIYDQLTTMGFTNLYNSDMIFWAYQIYVTKRQISSKDLADTIYNLNHTEGKIVLKNVMANITEKCTLRCKECSAFVQYIKSPKNYDKNTIIKSMRALSESVDAIDIISILGGEPLLHPDIVEICTEASKLKNVSKVRIVTNGTIIPKDEVLKSFSNCLFYVALSNYGELSSKKEILKNRLEDYGVLCELDNENLKWFQIFKPKKHNRRKCDNQKLFETCLWREQSVILQNGEFHACGYASNGKSQGFFKVKDCEYINLATSELSDLEKREVMKKLMTNTEVLSACDYCDIHNAMKIPAPRAVQTDKILTLE